MNFVTTVKNINDKGNNAQYQ